MVANTNIELKDISASSTGNINDTGENEGEGSKPSVDLDSILINEIGQFSWFQARVMVLGALAAVFSAFNGEYVFTTARIPNRCLIPQCEDVSNTELTPPWLELAVPNISGSFVSCQRYNYTQSAPDNSSCPANLFDRDVIVSCEEHFYENRQTVVYDFDLACSEWHRSLFGFGRTLGSFLALPLTGWMSDRWGRSTAMAFNAFNTAWVGLLRRWATNYTSFMVLEVMENLLGAGVFSCVYILVLEVVGPKYRVIAGALMSSTFAFGQVCLGLIAWAVPDWRSLTLALYVPQLITFSYFWIVHESVRWYMSKGRYEESETLLREIARINGRELSENSLQLLRETAEEDKKKKALEAEIEEPWLIVQVFRHKPILLRCLVSPVWWISTTLVYYGLSINSVNLSGNKYLNYVAVAAVEIPGFWISAFLLGRAGRKPVLMGAFWLCSACQVAYILMPAGSPALSLAVYLVGKCSISVVVTAIYVYTMELYPTRHRHKLLAFSSMIGRIGSIVAPLTPAMGHATFERMPFVLFGSFALVSGLLILLTPETLGCKLPDTMEEAEHMHKRKTIS